MSLMMQNFILFQLGWFCCVIGGASSRFYWIGVLAVAVIVAIHLLRASNRQDEIMLIIATTMLGTAWDSGLTMAGLLSFSNGVVLTGLVPIWMIAMWALFATTLHVSMGWMKNRPLLASVFRVYHAFQRLSAS